MERSELIKLLKGLPESAQVYRKFYLKEDEAEAVVLPVEGTSLNRTVNTGAGMRSLVCALALLAAAATSCNKQEAHVISNQIVEPARALVSGLMFIVAKSRVNVVFGHEKVVLVGRNKFEQSVNGYAAAWSNELATPIGGHTPAARSSSATPCMDALPRFTAANVPAFGPGETVSPAGRWTNGLTPPALPGNGLAQHPMLYVGENYDKMFLVKDGAVIWTYSTGTSYEYDDVWMLSNGNILYTRMEYIEEITPGKKVVWRYSCNKTPGTNHTEIHTCQPIGTDKVMFVVNGLPPRLMVVNIKTGVIEVEHALPFNQPPNPNGIHGQYRRARYTAQGTYLVSVFGMGYVAEYDKNFNEIWRYKIRSPWAALRLKNGNTLITDEAESLTREVNPRGETVWEFNTREELPAAYQFSSAPQTATRLANGNTILTSRGDNGKGPQLVEVTRDKQVVWVLQDWKTFGSATAVQILDDPGIPEQPGESEH